MPRNMKRRHTDHPVGRACQLWRDVRFSFEAFTCPVYDPAWRSSAEDDPVSDDRSGERRRAPQ